MLPAAISNPANTSTYASTIHCSWLVVAPSSRTNVGSATFTMVPSTTMMNTLVHSTARISHGERPAATGAGDNGDNGEDGDGEDDISTPLDRGYHTVITRL
mgnify:CR=1 FL=1